MADLDEKTVQELFAVLTTRWRDDRDILQIGVPRKRLEAELEMSTTELNSAMKQVGDLAKPLGLQLVRYTMSRDEWFCFRSSSILPTDLKEEDLSLLGVIIALVETDGKRCDTKDLHDRILRQDLMSPYSLDRSLKRLEHDGFIRRKSRGVLFGPRTLVEIGEDERERIKEKFKEFLL